jgi:hypothetical protein
VKLSSAGSPLWQVTSYTDSEGQWNPATGFILGTDAHGSVYAQLYQVNGHARPVSGFVQLDSSGAPHISDTSYTCSASSAAVSSLSGLLFITCLDGGLFAYSQQDGSIVSRTNCSGCSSLQADADGNLYVLAGASLLVFDSTGQLLGNITLAGQPSNYWTYGYQYQSMAWDPVSSQLYVVQQCGQLAVPCIAVFPSPMQMLLPPASSSSSTPARAPASSSSASSAVWCSSSSSSSVSPAASLLASSSRLSSPSSSGAMAATSSSAPYTSITSSSPTPCSSSASPTAGQRVSQASPLLRPVPVYMISLLLLLLVLLLQQW